MTMSISISTSMYTMTYFNRAQESDGEIDGASLENEDTLGSGELNEQ